MILRNAAANAAGLSMAIVTQAGLTFGAYWLIGPEQYGLVGFFTTLMMAAAIFDAGLGQTVLREIARRRDRPEELGQAAMSFVLFYVLLAAVLVGVVLLAAPLIARYWLKPESISPDDVTHAVRLMVIAIGIQRLRGVFQAMLDGLEKQVVTNLLLSGTMLFRLVLTLGTLLVSPTANAFFLAQIAASLVETTSFAVVTCRVVPAFRTAGWPDLRLALRGGAFAGTNAAAAAVGTFVQVADSLVVSACVPLAVFGHYSLVVSICQMMLRLCLPVLNAIYPRLSAYVHDEKADSLRQLYFTSSHIVAAMLATAAGTLAVFGFAYLELVAGRDTARDFAPVLALLAMAYGMNGLSRLPHVLQLAEGRPGYALAINAVLGALYLPAIVLLTPRFGVIAPAACLLLVNLCAFAAFVATGHRRSMSGQSRAWLTRAILLPIIGAGGCIVLARLVLPPDWPLSADLAASVAAAVIALAVALLAGQSTRHGLRAAVNAVRWRLRPRLKRNV